jgi:hypothetical protein
VDVARLVRGQEHRQVRDVLHLAPPLQRDRLLERLVEVLVVEELPGQRRLGVGRADAVDADPLLPVLDGQAAGEVGLRALRGVVDRLIGVAPEPGGGDEVDDVAAVALLEEPLDRLLDPTPPTGVSPAPSTTS